MAVRPAAQDAHGLEPVAPLGREPRLDDVRRRSRAAAQTDADAAASRFRGPAGLAKPLRVRAFAVGTGRRRRTLPMRGGRAAAGASSRRVSRSTSR